MRRALEVGVGTSLLLGPLVYALTLTSAQVAPKPSVELPVTVTVVERREPSTPATIKPSTPAVEPTPATPEPGFELAEFLFVTDAGVVLSSEAERGWGEGKLFEPEGTVTYRAAKRADPAKLPTELWSRVGRSYDLYGPRGKVCTARLGQPRVIAQYDGWSVGGLLGEEWYDTDTEPSKSAVRKALWQRDDLWLVAEIAANESCEGALWARDAELPPPAVLRESETPNPTSERRLAAFARSTDLADAKDLYETQYADARANAAEYGAEYLEGIEPWADYRKAHPAQVRSWLDAEARVQVVHLAFGREEEGCGDMFAVNFAALELVRGEAFEPVRTLDNPVAVFDADGDGQLELLFHGYEGDPHLVSATIEQSLTVEYDAYCPC